MSEANSRTDEMIISQPHKPKRKAVAAVELVVLLPLILLLLLGMWEVGRMVEVQQLLSNAAREGGRQASTGRKDVDEIKDDVIRYLTNNGIVGVTKDDITITNLTNSTRSNPQTAEQLDQFRITITIPFSSVRWAVLDQITNQETITGMADWYSMRDRNIEVDDDIPKY